MNYIESQLLEAVKQSLKHDLFSNAVFLCERLFAEVKNEDTRLLLAECYMGEGKVHKVYEILKDCTSAANRYKFALACIKLNKF
jgi:anaphase-promoting complex subunit 3